MELAAARMFGDFICSYMVAAWQVSTMKKISLYLAQEKECVN